MTKKSTSQSAFFNVRVLIGLFVVLAGSFMALASFGVFSATAANLAQALQNHQIITQSTDPLVPVGFDCSRIHELGIDRQENFRAGAIMIACGLSPSSATTATSTLGAAGRFLQTMLKPLAPSPTTYGAADVDRSTRTEMSPNSTQSH